MARKRDAVFDGFDRRVDRTACRVPQHHEQRRVEILHGVFKACDDIVIGKIAGQAADEQIASSRVEGIFRRNAGIGAAQDAGDRVLAPRQDLALVPEIVSPGHAIDVTTADASVLMSGSRVLRRLLRLRSFSDQHRLQDLVGNFFDGARRVRQEKRICLIAFSDSFKSIKILSHQHQLHNF
jgi:hypothetical protein